MAADPTVASFPAARARAAAAAALWILLAPAGLRGDEAAGAPEPAEPPSLLGDVSWHDGLRLALAVEGIPEVDYGDADVSWLRTTGRASLQGPVGEKWGLGVALSAELLSSDADAEASFLGPAAEGDGGALRDLFESILSLGVRRRIGERFALGADGYLAAKLELGADLGDSLKGGGVFTLAYSRSDTFNVAAGVKLGSRLDRSGVFAWPVLRIEWQITPRLTFQLRNVDLRLAYALSDELDFFVYGRAQTDRYRLERRTSGPLASDAGSIGVGDANVGLGLIWNPTEQWRVIGSTGVAVWDRVFVADSEDDRRAEREMTGAAPVVTLRLQRRF